MQVCMREALTKQSRICHQNYSTQISIQSPTASHKTAVTALSSKNPQNTLSVYKVRRGFKLMTERNNIH